MKVNLIKEASYELNGDKTTKINFDVFCKMTNVGKTQYVSDGNTPNVRIFSSIEEFVNSDLNLFDETKDIYILQNGNFCVFFKENFQTNTEKIINEPTDTKESKGEKS